MTTYAAVIGRKSLGSQVIGYVLNAPASLKSIEIVGAFTESGAEVNVTTHKISHSIKNIAKAKMTQPVSLDKKSGKYSFHFVD